MIYSKLKNKLKHHFHEVIKIKTTPHEIALGFSVGTLIGILPTPGFGILIGLIIILSYERISKLSLFGALAFWNPFMLTPIYILSYKIGDWIFKSEPVLEYKIEILNQIYNFTRRYLIGNLILAIFFSVISYFIIRKIVEIYQNRNKIK